jgi:hypothetical protein
MTPEMEAAISDSLASVAIGFMRSWEPPFYPERARGYFSSTDDFSLVIDGYHDGTYESWASGIATYMQHDRDNYKVYSHTIKEVKSLVLSPMSGAVTIVYVWEYVTLADEHFTVDAAATLVCRFENGRWRSVHYHGSHGEERLVDTELS